MLAEGKSADDPHHTRAAKLSVATELDTWTAREIVDSVSATLVRVWRIEGLGPRALDEGGVRGWNSIGWLTEWLKTLFKTDLSRARERSGPASKSAPGPGSGSASGAASASGSASTSLAALLGRLDEKGEGLFISSGSCLPVLFEWIAENTGSLDWPAESTSIAQYSLTSLSARLHADPPSRTVYKERHQRRSAEAAERALHLLGADSKRIRAEQTKTPSEARDETAQVETGRADPAELGDARDDAAPDSTGRVDDERGKRADNGGATPAVQDHRWIDRRFHGLRILQHPLAEQLRAAGWSFRLQGAWDPHPAPHLDLELAAGSTPASSATSSAISPTTSPARPAKQIASVRITLFLGERDPSDLVSGGACRFVTLGDVETRWKQPEESDGNLIPDLLARRFRETLQSIADGSANST